MLVLARRLLSSLAVLLALAVAGPCRAAGGLVGSYFNNTTLTGTVVLARNDTTVNFAWGAGSPDSSVNSTNFGARWSGYVRVQTTGSYLFQTVSDKGMRLSVNGSLIISDWGPHGATTDTSAAVALTAGVDYPITLDYYETTGSAQITLAWKKPGDSGYSIVPASNGSLGLSTGLAPVLEYRFEQAAWTGATGEVTDTSASGWNGTAASLSATKPTTASTSPAIPGSPGTCRYAVLNRANKDYVALPSSFMNLGASGSFTATAWLRATDSTLSGQRLLIDDEDGYLHQTIGSGLSLGDAGAGKLSFYTRATATPSLDTASVIASNTWYFVAFGVDYVNKIKFITVLNTSGTVLASVTATYAETSIGKDTGATSFGGETNAALGGENTSSYGFGGNLDELRVYPFVLTGAEMVTVSGLTSACPPGTLVAQYHVEDAVYAGAAGELKDSAGYSGGPYNGQAQGSPLPTPLLASPALGNGSGGTCGYASMPGPINNGGSFVVRNLPTSTTLGAQTSVSFWMYWDGTDNVMPISFDLYNVAIYGSIIGFNTQNADIQGTSASGLSGGWHHVVAIFANGNVANSQLYIDAVAQTLTPRYQPANNSRAYVSGTLTIGGYTADSTVYRFSGRLDEVKVFNGAVTAAQVTALYTETHACQTLNHLALQHPTGTGLTCTPSTMTVVACQDAACATPYTLGESGTLTATGAGMTVNWPSGAGFSIGAGSSSTSVSLQQVTAGSVLLGLTAASVPPANATTCNFGSPTCTYTAADSGLLFNVPNGLADAVNSVTVSAVKKSDNTAACVPAFASISKPVVFKCSYTNPASGTWAVRVGGAALNAANSATSACDGTGRSVSLAFDGTGKASTTVQYADAGNMTLNATYTGTGADAGLTMTGTDGFISAPASFALSGVTNAPIKAGAAFAATVTARNSSGAATPNFGRETTPESATLTFARFAPTGTGARDGAFTGSLGAFTAGVASASNLVWSEVGTGDLTATLASASYLGSGLSATGSTGSAGAVGRFTPHHFTVAATPACGSFTYAGQPFTVTVTAMNGLAVPGTTANYDGSANTSPSFAKVVTLSDAGPLGLGSLGGNSMAVSAFVAGVATTVTPAYTYTTKLTAASMLTVRATDTDAIASAGFAEGSTGLRSGRLRLSNAFGSEKNSLPLTLQAQYWGGNTWVPNSADSCTVVPLTAVVLGNYLDNRGIASSNWTTTASAVPVSRGSGTLTLTAPSPTMTGSVDLALNLGSSTADQSCLASHPASTGAGVPWLRSQQGSCATTWDRDPAARASFGIYSPETRKALHVREIY